MCWERPVMSRPSKTTRPSLGRSAPGMTLKKVLLPAPFGPMIEVSRPRGNATDTSQRARKAPKVLPTPSALRMVSPLTAPAPPTARRGGCPPPPGPPPRPREQRAPDPAREEEHEDHEQRPRHELPVRRDERHLVLDQEEHGLAHEGTEKGSYAPH